MARTIRRESLRTGRRKFEFRDGAATAKAAKVRIEPPVETDIFRWDIDCVRVGMVRRSFRGTAGIFRPLIPTNTVSSVLEESWYVKRDFGSHNAASRPGSGESHM